MKHTVPSFLTSTLLLVLLAIVPLACGDSDQESSLPENTRDIAVTFRWTAVGDDGAVGQADRYDLRYALDSTDLTQHWSQAAIVRNLPRPAAAGSAEEFTTTLRLELNRTCYFAIRAGDEAGNWAPISNVIAYTPTDSSASTASIDFDAATN